MALRAGRAGKDGRALAETVGCPGGAVGLGFADGFPDVERHSYFLSVGVEGTGAPERLLEQARAMPESPMKEHILHGERYWRDPAAAAAFLDCCRRSPCRRRGWY